MRAFQEQGALGLILELEKRPARCGMDDELDLPDVFFGERWKSKVWRSFQGQYGFVDQWFHGSVGIYNNLHVELMGLLYGLQLAWDMRFKKVICYSDSMDVISLVHGSWPNHHHYMAIVLRIQDLIHMD
ncbi:hypothetical protein Lal_00025269 [Lupinus albus]|nr:hypothetical protein Lal_00025269 [Lupinus albus]